MCFVTYGWNLELNNVGLLKFILLLKYWKYDCCEKILRSN